MRRGSTQGRPAHRAAAPAAAVAAIEDPLHVSGCSASTPPFVDRLRRRSRTRGHAAETRMALADLRGAGAEARNHRGLMTRRGARGARRERNRGAGASVARHACAASPLVGRCGRARARRAPPRLVPTQDSDLTWRTQMSRPYTRRYRSAGQLRLALGSRRTAQLVADHSKSAWLVPTSSRARGRGLRAVNYSTATRSASQQPSAALGRLRHDQRQRIHYYIKDELRPVLRRRCRRRSLPVCSPLRAHVELPPTQLNARRRSRAGEHETSRQNDALADADARSAAPPPGTRNSRRARRALAELSARVNEVRAPRGRRAAAASSVSRLASSPPGSCPRSTAGRAAGRRDRLRLAARFHEGSPHHRALVRRRLGLCHHPPAVPAAVSPSPFPVDPRDAPSFDAATRSCSPSCRGFAAGVRPVAR